MGKTPISHNSIVLDMMNRIDKIITSCLSCYPVILSKVYLVPVLPVSEGSGLGFKKE
jgi:hypothetical protein